MSNKLFFVGYDKESVLFFSKESKAYIILWEIFKTKLPSKIIDFDNFRNFYIDSSEANTVLREFEEMLNLEYVFLNEIKQCEYIEAINKIKKSISTLRDENSKRTRTIIKLYTSFYHTLKSKDRVYFISHNSGNFLDVNW